MALFNFGGGGGRNAGRGPGATVAPWLQGLSLQDLQSRLSGVQGQQDQYMQSIAPWRDRLGQRFGGLSTLYSSYQNMAGGKTMGGQQGANKFLKQQAGRLGISPQEFGDFQRLIMGQGDSIKRQSELSDLQSAIQALSGQAPGGQQPPQASIPQQPSAPAPLPGGGTPPPLGGQPGGSIPNTPGYGQFGSFDPAQLSNGPLRDMVNNIANQFQQGSITNFNRAAGRLRERLDSAGAANADRITNANVGRGFGFSGSQDRQLQRAAADTQSAYGQGLVNLENQFEDQRQKGLQGALNATQQLFGNDQFSQDLAGRILMGRENNASSERNAKLGANSDFLRSIFSGLFGRQ